jgi:hypothetical protein
VKPDPFSRPPTKADHDLMDEWKAQAQYLPIDDKDEQRYGAWKMLLWLKRQGRLCQCPESTVTAYHHL